MCEGDSKTDASVNTHFFICVGVDEIGDYRKRLVCALGDDIRGDAVKSASARTITAIRAISAFDALCQNFSVGYGVFVIIRNDVNILRHSIHHQKSRSTLIGCGQGLAS